jgi:hypothetical protein
VANEGLLVDMMVIIVNKNGERLPQDIGKIRKDFDVGKI